MPFYYYGIIHGDPHPGNYTVRKDNGINLLDLVVLGSFDQDLLEVLLIYIQP